MLDTPVKLRLELSTMEDLAWNKFRFGVYSVKNWLEKQILSWGKGVPWEVRWLLTDVIFVSHRRSGLCESRQSRRLWTWSVLPGLCLYVLCSVAVAHIIWSLLSPTFPVCNFLPYLCCLPLASLNFSVSWINVPFFLHTCVWLIPSLLTYFFFFQRNKNKSLISLLCVYILSSIFYLFWLLRLHALCCKGLISYSFYNTESSLWASPETWDLWSHFVTMVILKIIREQLLKGICKYSVLKCQFWLWRSNLNKFIFFRIWVDIVNWSLIVFALVINAVVLKK